jgi:hypothetical protein
MSSTWLMHVQGNMQATPKQGQDGPSEQATFHDHFHLQVDQNAETDTVKYTVIYDGFAPEERVIFHGPRKNAQRLALWKTTTPLWKSLSDARMLLIPLGPLQSRPHGTFQY